MNSKYKNLLQARKKDRIIYWILSIFFNDLLLKYILFSQFHQRQKKLKKRRIWGNSLQQIKRFSLLQMTWFVCSREDIWHHVSWQKLYLFYWQLFEKFSNRKVKQKLFQSFFLTLKTNILASLMLWSEENERVAMQNPAVTFPSKKIINTELFIDERSALYMVDDRIKNLVIVVITNGTDTQIEYIPYAKSTERCWNEKPIGSLFWNDFDGNVEEVAHDH